MPQPAKVAPATQPAGPTPGPNVDVIAAPTEIVMSLNVGILPFSL